MIKRELNLKRDVAVLMGANVASDVARGDFVEATIACADVDVVRKVALLFESKSFRTEACTDVSTVELCAALKNVVAMGAGFCDGLKLGCSTKAAIIRQGMAEMASFCQQFAPDTYELDTMMKSCGVADVIATSFGGRNRCVCVYYDVCVLLSLACTWSLVQNMYKKRAHTHT